MGKKKRLRKNRYKVKRNSGRLVRIFAHLALGAKATFALLSLFLLSLAFILGHDYLTQCDFFQAKQIRISGNHRLTQDEILTVAGVAKGMNILAVNLSVVQKRLMNHPWIEAAQASREIPDGLMLKVWEHQPLAIFNLDQQFILNSRGRLFKQWRSKDPAGLPTVSGLRYSDVPFQNESTDFERIDQRRNSSFRSVMEILQIYQKQGNLLAGQPLRHIEVDREIGLTLHLGDSGRIIKLGYDNYPQKLQRLKRVSALLNSGQPFKDYQSIDLKSPRRIVLNPIRSSAGREQKEV